MDLHNTHTTGELLDHVELRVLHGEVGSKSITHRVSSQSHPKEGLAASKLLSTLDTMVLT
jgi:hypothetical protein